jgi:prepilin-type N-terminal cleavage/methylation domain-containing protein
MNQCRQGGFTLIEIIVVMAIIALLVVALQPAISSALGRGEEAETDARILGITAAIIKFEAAQGYYPPDDFVEPAESPLQVKCKSDSINAGIESLVLFLCWSGQDLTDLEEWFANTDGDDNGTMIPILERTAKVEIVDAWGTPLAYFRNNNYTKVQEIALGGEAAGETVKARAFKNPNSTGFLAPRKFQIVSAGPDMIFNTDDDIVYPPLPR